MKELWIILGILSATLAAAFLFAAMMGFQVSMLEEKPGPDRKTKTWIILDAICFGSIGTAIVGALKNWKHLPESRQSAASGIVSSALAVLFFYLSGKVS